MAVRRRDDGPASRTRFRTDRMVQDGGRWFFLTREGTMEGPFASRDDATEQLGVYITLAISGMLPQGAGAALELESSRQTRGRTREGLGQNFQCWPTGADRKGA